VSRGIAVLFLRPLHYKGVSDQSHALAASILGKDPVPNVQEAGWAPGPVWTGGKSRPHRDSIPDCPTRSQSTYRLSYPTHISELYNNIIIRKVRNYVITWIFIKICYYQWFRFGYFVMYLTFSMLRTKYVALQSVCLPRLCANCAGSVAT